MAVNLTKGQRVSLTKENPGLSKVIVGLGWDVNSYEGDAFDLDASAFALNSEGKCPTDKDFVFFNSTKNANGSISHSGDNLTGEGEGDDEQITVDLANVPAEIEKVAFAITIYQADERDQNFGMVDNAFVRVVDANTNSEIIRYDITEDFSIETALVVGELYRDKENGWKFAAIGQGFSGGLASLTNKYGL